MVNPGGNYFDLAQIPNGGCNLNCCIKIFDTPMSSIGPTPISTIVRKLFEPWVQTKRKIPYLFVKYIFIPEIYTQQIIKKSFLCLSPRRAIKRKMYVILFIFKVCIHTLNKHLKISKKIFLFYQEFFSTGNCCTLPFREFQLIQAFCSGNFINIHISSRTLG